jgi:hypothetical protein
VFTRSTDLSERVNPLNYNKLPGILNNLYRLYGDRLTYSDIISILASRRWSKTLQINFGDRSTNATNADRPKVTDSHRSPKYRRLKKEVLNLFSASGLTLRIVRSPCCELCLRDFFLTLSCS